MPKNRTLALAAFLISVFATSALADPEPSSQTSAAPVKTDDAAESPKTPPTTAAKNPSMSKASLPKKLCGLLIGTVVGTPVCVIRKSIEEEKYGINGMIGTSNNKAAQITAGALWLPFAVFTGTVESPVYSAIDSLRADEPFSKQQFSLGDVKPKTPAQQ